MNSYFSVTAKKLIAINEKAFEEGQNMVLNIQDKYSNPETKPVEVDALKKALVRPFMIHTNSDGTKAWRCNVLFGVVGQSEAEEGILDVPYCFRRELLKYPVLPDGSVGEPMTEHPLIIGSYAETLDEPKSVPMTKSKLHKV